MSDRIAGITVCFKESLPEEAVDNLAGLLRWLDGVVRVEKHVDNHVLWLAKSQIRSELHEKLWKALEDDK